MRELLIRAINTIGLLNSCVKCGEVLMDDEEKEIKNLILTLQEEVKKCESENKSLYTEFRGTTEKDV